MTEFELALESMSARLLLTADIRVPKKSLELDPTEESRLAGAVAEAVYKAETDAGVVLNVSCGNLAELVHASALIEAVSTNTSLTKSSLVLVPEKSNESKFEFSNNSVIYLTLRKEASK